MSGRRIRLGWFGLIAAVLSVLAVAAVLSACGGDEDDAVEPPAEPPAQSESQNANEESAEQSEEETVRERVLTLTSADAGEHLEARSYAAGLPSWLEASEDRMLSSLPGRALAVSGIVFSPSGDSPTGETLWLHVFTDESAEAASDWVKYAASQPPQLVSVIVPHHELFEARFMPAPLVGDASVAIELFHGHSGICVRSALLVFAQEGVLVFLFNSIEITSGNVGAAVRSGGGIPSQCEVGRAANRLTDVEAIADLISERLSVGG